MKLPWDQRYIKISFHVVVTVVVIYALNQFVDMFAYGVTNMDKFYGGLTGIIGSIFSLFSCVVIGFIIAYLLDPVAEFFQVKYEAFHGKHLKSFRLPFIKEKKKERKVPEFRTRTAGATLSYLCILAVIALACMSIYSKVSKYGGNNFVESFALFVSQSINDFYDTYRKLEENLVQWGIYTYIADIAKEVVYAFTDFLKGIGVGIVDITKSIGGGFVNFFIGAVVAFYFIKDKELIQKKMAHISDVFFSKKVNTITRNTLMDISSVFSGYIRGQLTDACIMACLISIGLKVIGVEFAFLIGIVSGFSNIIPYFGAIMGLVLAVSVALISGEPIQALYAGALMLALQQIDSIFIAPKVVGESVELSPAMVLIALSVAGTLFGIPGMALAVPVFATCKLFLAKYLKRREIAREKQL